MSQYHRSDLVGKFAGCSIVYDLRAGIIDRDITDYSIYLIRKKDASPLTVSQAIGHLISFRRFLSRQKHPSLDLIYDELMIKFRDEELKSVTESRAFRGDERLAKATVNQKLGAIYRWLIWLRDEGRVNKNVIGVDNCQVEVRERRVTRQAGEKLRTAIVLDVPILFRGVARGSKHSTAYSATAADVSAIRARLITLGTSEYLRQRNALLASIPEQTGFRRGSMNSLLVSQFDEQKLVAERNVTVAITPASQKNGYSNTFEIPTILALGILDFIQGPRAELLAAIGIDESVAKGRVFLSETTGKPLQNGSITRILSKEMRAVGAPKGAAVHAGRHLYANDTIDKEIRDRTASGQDTSTASICNAVALKLGQRNPDSLFAYVSAQQGRFSQRHLAARRLESSEEHSGAPTTSYGTGKPETQPHTDAAEAGSKSKGGIARLLVIDVNILGFGAMRAERYRDRKHLGRRTGAIVGVMDELARLRTSNHDRLPVVLWDDRCDWREKLLPTYKVHRWNSLAQRAMLEEYLWQTDVLRELFTHLGLTQIGATGYEADDLAGAICRHCDPNWSIRLVTSDTDWLQALRPGVDIYSPSLKTVLSDKDLGNPELVHGGPFNSVGHFVSAKALAGDASDGIPGVPGIGLKSAAKIIREYGSMEALWALFDQQSPIRGEALRRAAGPEYRATYLRNLQLIDWTRAPPLGKNLRVDAGTPSVDRYSAISASHDLPTRVGGQIAEWVSASAPAAGALVDLLQRH
jgi:5'-3' exonuclease